MHHQINKKMSKLKLVKTAILAGLIVGSMDILAAIVQTLITKGDPIKLFQFIASGLFGRQSFSGGVPYAILGLFFHYTIAIGWTILFFIIYPRVKFMTEFKILTGLLYGCFIWLVMNQVVLPLSNTPPIPFSVLSAVVGALILVCAIGLPLSFLAQRFYSRK